MQLEKYLPTDLDELKNVVINICQCYKRETISEHILIPNVSHQILLKKYLMSLSD